MSKKIRTAEEWADFFVEDYGFGSECDIDSGDFNEDSMRVDIIKHLGDGNKKRIPNTKKLNDLTFKYLAFDVSEGYAVEVIKPLHIIEGGEWPNYIYITHEYGEGSKYLTAEYTKKENNRIYYRVICVSTINYEEHMSGLSYEFVSQYENHKKTIFFNDVLFLDANIKVTDIDGNIGSLLYTGRYRQNGSVEEKEYVKCSNNGGGDVEVIIPQGDVNSPELRRLPSIDEESGEVTNMELKYKTVEEYCWLECPDDTICGNVDSDDCHEYGCCDFDSGDDDCNSY